jgi:hypothetical protein
MQLTTNVVGINVTTKCNLNCAYCSIGVPRFKKASVESGARIETDPESLKRSLAGLFDIYDHLRHIDFTGGEVFVWDASTGGALSEIVRHCARFKGKFSFGRILTNSTIVPRDELLETIANCGYDFDFLLDNYGELSKPIGEIRQKLDYYKIKYVEYKYYGEGQEFKGWINIHNDYEYKNYSEGRLKEVWNTCNLANRSSARNLYNDYLYFCCAAVVLRGACGMELNSGYVPTAGGSVPIEERRKTAASWSEQPIEYCKYCNGWDPNTSPRILAAEQIDQPPLDWRDGVAGEIY